LTVHPDSGLAVLSHVWPRERMDTVQFERALAASVEMHRWWATMLPADPQVACQANT
jgi:hypothetical protein